VSCIAVGVGLCATIYGKDSLHRFTFTLASYCVIQFGRLRNQAPAGSPANGATALSRSSRGGGGVVVRKKMWEPLVLGAFLF
jgi:hypothetical protein